jgi:fumarate reductase subunit C
MIWFKSLMVGLSAVVTAITVSLVLLVVLVNVKSNGPIAVDVVSFVRRPHIQLLMAIVFVAGFLWEYFRLAPK